MSCNELSMRQIVCDESSATNCPVTVFFYFTPFQQQLLHKSFCYHLKLSYGLSAWSDHFFFSLTGEYTLLDRLYIYWRRFEVALLTGSDALGLAHQWTFYRSLHCDVRAFSLRAEGFRLNHRQLRLFGERYIHVFQLWFQFRLSYRSLFSFYLREWNTSLLSNMLTFFWYWLSSSDSPQLSSICFSLIGQHRFPV